MQGDADYQECTRMEYMWPFNYVWAGTDRFTLQYGVLAFAYITFYLFLKRFAISYNMVALANIGMEFKYILSAAGRILLVFGANFLLFPIQVLSPYLDWDLEDVTLESMCKKKTKSLPIQESNFRFIVITDNWLSSANHIFWFSIIGTASAVALGLFLNKLYTDYGSKQRRYAQYTLFLLTFFTCACFAWGWLLLHLRFGTTLWRLVLMMIGKINPDQYWAWWLMDSETSSDGYYYGYYMFALFISSCLTFAADIFGIAEKILEYREHMQEEEDALRELEMEAGFRSTMNTQYAENEDEEINDADMAMYEQIQAQKRKDKKEKKEKKHKKHKRDEDDVGEGGLPHKDRNTYMSPYRDGGLDDVDDGLGEYDEGEWN